MSSDEEELAQITEVEKKKLLDEEYDVPNQPRVSDAATALLDPYKYILHELGRVRNSHTGWSKHDPDVQRLVVTMRRILAYDPRLIESSKRDGTCVFRAPMMDGGILLEATYTICAAGCIHTSEPRMSYTIQRSLEVCSQWMGYAKSVKRDGKFCPTSYHSYVTGETEIRAGCLLPSDDVAFDAYHAAVYSILENMYGLQLKTPKGDKTFSVRRAYLEHTEYCAWKIIIEWADRSLGKTKWFIGSHNRMLVPCGNEYQYYVIEAEDVHACLDKAARVHVPAVVRRAMRTGEHGDVRKLQYRSGLKNGGPEEPPEVKQAELSDDE